jgi:predicted GTPase
MVVNNTQGFSDPYRRYLLGVLRDQLTIGEVPIKLYLQSRARHDDRDDLQMKEEDAAAAEG